SRSISGWAVVREIEDNRLQTLAKPGAATELSRPRDLYFTSPKRKRGGTSRDPLPSLARRAREKRHPCPDCALNPRRLKDQAAGALNLRRLKPELQQLTNPSSAFARLAPTLLPTQN